MPKFDPLTEIPEIVVMFDRSRDTRGLDADYVRGLGKLLLQQRGAEGPATMTLAACDDVVEFPILRAQIGLISTKHAIGSVMPKGTIKAS